MKLNSEFTEEIGLPYSSFYNSPENIFRRSVLRNDRLLQIRADFNEHFIRTTGVGVIQPEGADLDILEANIQEIVEWFEKQIREWVDCDKG